MFKIKFLISIFVFSTLLVGTSAIKNQSRELEKKIYNLKTNISLKERDLSETQLDLSYLTSPIIVEQKINSLNDKKYIPMDYSRIFLSILSFTELQNKFVNQKIQNEKKIKKK